MLAPELLRDFVLEADRAQVDLHIHAIGDRAVRDALDAFEVARRDNPNRGTRHTIAHVELIDDADLPRFAELDVIAQTTPAWHSGIHTTGKRYSRSWGRSDSIDSTAFGNSSMPAFA